MAVLSYEVSATVQPELRAEFESYMRGRHIPEVLATRSFIGASFATVGENRYRTAYFVADDATLQRYLEEHAPALRADFAKHFPVGVELSREVWRELERWAKTG
jgi:hypothetical protein